MENTYHIFGLNITSAIPLPATPAVHRQPDAAPDVVIAYGKTPETLTNPRIKGVRFQAGPGEVLLHVDGVARYHVQEGRCVTIEPEAGANEDDILIF